jgi:hypothetical protein
VGEVTKRSQPWRRLALVLALALGAPLWLDARSAATAEERLDGLNVIASEAYPFGSAAARQSLARAKMLGAHAVAIVFFLWQPTPSSPELERGSDTSDGQLRVAIRDAHALGLKVVVKPHVWIPASWAGAVVMASEGDWQEWFANYQRELNNVAKIAAEEAAEALAIGTELSQTEQRPEWQGLIAAARKLYFGRLFYLAHNCDEAEKVPFWDRLDAVGATLYPPLGDDTAREARRRVMRKTADCLEALALRYRKPVVVGEIGLRSATGAAAKPWESSEERDGEPDLQLQSTVIGDWLDALDRPSIEGVLVWSWLTDPRAGGLTDTDFTVQNKPAEHVLACAWTRICDRDHAAIGVH